MSDIKFDIAMDTNSLNFPHKAQGTSYVDEEGLLPGAHEAHETNGILHTLQTQAQEIQFEAIHNQYFLTQLGLSSKGMPLHYELAHNNHLLIATAGTTNIAVFTAYLDPNGSYSFTLHNHIDRAPPPNLIHNVHSNEPGSPGWTAQPFEPPATHKMSVSQEISTHPQEPYLLSFHFQPNLNNATGLKETQVFWDNKLIYTLSPDQVDGKNYNFSVEGTTTNTKLQFVSEGIQDQFNHVFHDVCVTSAAQNKLPIPFCYNVHNAEGHVSHEQFTVNVTITPPIEINNKEPVDVIYDQGVYQTIIVQGQGEHHDIPLTTINIDNLFKNLAISSENRLVEIIQREANGQGTNVYEIQISDKSQPTVPITVADVQLSFPGGDGGLAVFHRNVMIDEGGGGILPPQDHQFG